LQLLALAMKTTTAKTNHLNRNSRWRAKKNEEAISITEQLNAKRAELSLPPVSWTLKHHCPFKGGKRPGYNPPKDLRMTKQQASQWRHEEKKKRKAIKQRENRMMKKAMLNQMKEELDELDQRIEAKKQTMEVKVDRKVKQTLRVTADKVVSLKNDPKSGLYIDTEETLLADPYIEHNFDTVPWMNGDVKFVSPDEITRVFD
jgi:hypothetical protein